MEHTSHKKILVVGSYNVGLTCKTDRVPVWGETLLGTDFSMSYGGKGANQAVAASRLGAEVSFIGCLGNDQFGEDGMKMLRNENIQTNEITRSDQNTGVGFIFLNDEGENCILVDPGANNDLAVDQVIQSQAFIEADLIIFQLENQLQVVKEIMKEAKAFKKTVILNPAPASKEAIELLQYADIINPNESELLILNEESPSKDMDLATCKSLAKNLLDKGPKTIICTRGEAGALVVSQNEEVEVPSRKVTVEDSTGAGDSFTGALAVALSEGKSIEESVKLATLVGAYSVTKRDVIPSLPYREELKEFATSK